MASTGGHARLTRTSPSTRDHTAAATVQAGADAADVLREVPTAHNAGLLRAGYGTDLVVLIFHWAFLMWLSGIHLVYRSKPFQVQTRSLNRQGGFGLTIDIWVTCREGQHT